MPRWTGGADYRRMDWFLLACVAALVTYGVVFVASAQDAESGRFAKQIVWVAAGVVVMAVVIHVDYMAVMKRAGWIYVFGCILLLAVLFSRPINNSNRWFDLGFFKLQPSEFFKFAWVLAMARYLGTERGYKRLSGIWIPLALTFAPLALILKQPDLGTSMIFVPAMFAMLYAANARGKHLALIAGGGAAGAVVMWFGLMHDYQKRRVLAWLNPEEYSLTDAYQLMQSLKAIGSGGLTGQGLGRGELNKLNLVPVKDTDLIFTVIAEEWGYVGCIALLMVFALFIVACFEIARRTREPQGRLLAVGVTAVLAFQAVVNTWVVTGLLPTTGVSLPFVSYGGSSMLSSMLGVGLLLSVALRRHATLGRDPFDD